MSKNETDLNSWFDVVGPKVRLLSDPQTADFDFAVMEARLGPGVFVPLHSHDDREAFVVTSGSAEVFVDGQWQKLEQGQSVDIAPNKIHAWRNSSKVGASLILVTTEKMRKFFVRIARPLDAGLPSGEDLVELFNASREFGYEMAPPDENEAIGLALL